MVPYWGSIQYVSVGIHFPSLVSGYLVHHRNTTMLHEGSDKSASAETEIVPPNNGEFLIGSI